MIALKALKALKSSNHFKASKRGKLPKTTQSHLALKALKSETISKHPKNLMISSFEALKALNPLTGGNGAFQSAPSPTRGVAQILNGA
jgi:hypothetical protein